MSGPTASPSAIAAPFSGGAAIAIFAGLSALGQFASNIYLPSLPAVAADLAAPLATVQITATAFLATVGAVQLLYGPLSDRYGRKRVLAWGVLFYVAGSALCAAAPSIEWLIAARAAQAAGAGAGLVLARAMVRDLHSGPELQRMMAAITMAFALVPGLTPFLGGVLEASLGWRSTFLFTALLGVVTLTLVAGYLPETNRTPVARLDLGAAASGYLAAIRVDGFLRLALATACVVGAMAAFFVGSPGVFIDELGVSPVEYGLYPPLAVSGFLVGGMVTRRMAGRVSAERLALLGLIAMGVAVWGMLGLLAVGLVHKFVIAGAMVVYVSGLGVFMPTAIAAALSMFADRIGIASAVRGFLQMAMGALATGLTSLLQPLTPMLAFPLIMAAATTAATLVLVKRRRA